MRSLMFALVCGAAVLFCEPAAAAQPAAPQEPAVTDEAPVDVEAEHMFCPRRMGGPSARRAAQRCVSAAPSNAPSFGAATCAVRYAYRGHRRAYYRPRTCEPLFQRGSTSAI
jgi:hypothetical protein